MRAILTSSSRKHPSLKLDSGDLTENTADFSSQGDADEREIELEITAPHSIRQSKTSCVPHTDTARSLLSSRTVEKSKKGSNPMPHSTLKTDELVRQKSVRGGRRNSTTNLSGFLENAEQQQLEQAPKEERRRPSVLVFRTSSSVSGIKSSSCNDLKTKKLSSHGKERKAAPKRADSVSLCGESTTTPKTAQSGMDRRAAFGASKQLDAVLSARFLQASAAEWEDEYQKIAALESDDDDAVVSFQRRSLENCKSSSSRRLVSRTRTDDISPAVTVGRVSSSVIVGDDMWTQYDQIIASDADEKSSDFELTKEEGKGKKKSSKSSSKVPKKSDSTSNDSKRLSSKKC